MVVLITNLEMCSKVVLHGNMLLPPTLQESKLLEACRYGLMEQVHKLLITGVNVNVAGFVSSLPDIRLLPVVSTLTILLIARTCH